MFDSTSILLLRTLLMIAPVLTPMPSEASPPKWFAMVFV
jgi:hypothetical protein